MNRGRGRGVPRASPHSPVDHRSHTHVRAEPSSSRHMSGSRKEKFSPGTEKLWQPKKAQPGASEASAGKPSVMSSSTGRTDCEDSSHELKNRAEIVDRDTKQSDMSPDCVREGCVDGHVKSGGSRETSWKRNQGNYGQRHKPSQDHNRWKQAKPVLPDKDHDQPLMENLESSKSSGSRETSGKRDQRPNDQRHTAYQDVTEWKQAKPVSYEATIGNAKSVVHNKDSAAGPLDLDRSLMENLESSKSGVSTEYADHNRLTGSEDSEKCDSSHLSNRAAAAEPFDICPPKDGVYKPQSSLYTKNREMRNQIKDSLAPKSSLLRSGMVLLKNFISVGEQVKIVKECRKLGLGIGGFYQPGYRGGAKLSLRMMCLGKNWDPETSRYDDVRPIDGAKPPPIPSSFFELIRRSIKESHNLIAKECGLTERVQDILPSMSPDICIVNFYTISGKLGLHQDRDESEASLHKGLPVVSISIGDKAEFLYGDQSEMDKAEKVILESGDVLIFGGESRHVFHGVSSIIPKTAPESLLRAEDLRPGRLNLTFRKY